MIVRSPGDEMWGDQPFEMPERGAYHGGCISPECEVRPDDKPRRPIGFRMPEKEPEPPSPDWMLL